MKKGNKQTNADIALSTASKETLHTEGSCYQVYKMRFPISLSGLVLTQNTMNKHVYTAQDMSGGILGKLSLFLLASGLGGGEFAPSI